MEKPRPETAGSQLVNVLRDLTLSLRRLDSPGDPSAAALSLLGRVVAGDGEARVTELARDAGTSQPAATQLVDRLERAEMVRRVPDPQDRRGTLVAATSAGRALLAQVRAQRAGAMDALLEELSPDDRETIDGALPALTRLAELAARPSPAGDTSVPAFVENGDKEAGASSLTAR